MKLFHLGWIILAAFSNSTGFAGNEADLQRLKAERNCVNCDLSEFDLSEIDLSGAHLEGTDFTGSSLLKTNFTRAFLQGARLDYLQLAGSILSETQLPDGTVTGREVHPNGKSPQVVQNLRKFDRRSAYYDVYKNCINHQLMRWKSLQCVFFSNEEYRLNQPELLGALLFTPFIEGARIVDTAIIGAYRSLKYGKDGEWESVLRHLGWDRTGESSAILGDLKAMKESIQLSDCQAACLTSCATSAILTYVSKEEVMNKFSSMAHLIYDRRGECTEFSCLASEVGRALGLQIYEVGNFKQRHAYNAVVSQKDGFFLFDPLIFDSSEGCVLMRNQ